MNELALFQPIRSDGPQTHITTKKKTPTMGGIFIVLSTILSTILFVDYSNSYIIIISMIMFSFAMIGLVDDLLKVIYKNPNGFRGSYKIVIQFIIIGIAILWLGYVDLIHLDNKIFFPVIDYHLTLFSILYIVFVNFVIVGTSNAVNLTDGLDGLVSVPAIINLICLIILIYWYQPQKLLIIYRSPKLNLAEKLSFFA